MGSVASIIRSALFYLHDMVLVCAAVDGLLGEQVVDCGLAEVRHKIYIGGLDVARLVELQRGQVSKLWRRADAIGTNRSLNI